MNNRKIVIFSDCTDIAYHEVHQVLSDSFEREHITDIQIAPFVPIKNFSIIHAAFSVRLLAEIYPKGTIFLVIANGASSNPARIFGQTNNGIIFVGSNLGYFNWMIQDFGLKCLYKNKMDRTKDSRSFGGKYVQAPTVAKIASGIDYSVIGDEVDIGFLENFPIPDGTVLHCDNFGLMKIKAKPLTGFHEGDRFCISLNHKPILKAIYTESMKKCADGSWVLFSGSSLYGLPELGRVRSLNSANEINVKEGDIISWEQI